MKLPKRPTEPVEFILDVHKGIEGAPVFTLKPLSVGRLDEVANLVTSQKQMTALRHACNHGIKGWSNLEPEFTSEHAIGLIEGFELVWITELGNKIVEISQVTEQEKN